MEHIEQGGPSRSPPDTISLPDKHDIDENTHINENDAAALDYPEGIRAWSVVLGVVLLQFTTFGYTNGHGIFTDFYVRDYLSHYSSSAIGWIGSTQLMLTLSCGILSGRAYDAGYFYPLVYSGSFLLIFSAFMLSLTQPQQFYQVFLCQGLGIGLANGIIFVPSLGIVAQHFQRRRVLALGIASAGSGLGGLVHPIMLNKLIHSPLGFHKATRISAAMNAMLVLLGLALVQTRTIIPASNRKDNPLRQFCSFFREPAYLCTVTATFFVIIGIYFPIFFIQLNNITNGIKPNLAFYTLSVLNGCNTLGRVAPMLLGAQRFGVFNSMIFFTAGIAVLVFSVIAIKSAVPTFAFCIIFGFFSGAYTGLLAPAISSLAKTDSEIGSRLGICFMFTGLAGLIGTPIAGALLTIKFYWVRPIVFAGLCATTGLTLFLIVRILLVRQKSTQRI